MASASSTTNPRISVVTAPSFVLLCGHHRARAGRSKWETTGCTRKRGPHASAGRNHDVEYSVECRVEKEADPTGSSRCRRKIQELGQMGPAGRDRNAELHGA